MIKKSSKYVIMIALLIGMSFTLTGCSNLSTTVFGGTKEIYLPEGMKFLNYNIQDTNKIWCTYRPMRDDEIAETYIVQQDKEGILSVVGDGKFVIYETKDGVQSPKIDDVE